MQLNLRKKRNFKARQRRTEGARVQPLIDVRPMCIAWFAERRLVAHNPSLARQALMRSKCQRRLPISVDQCPTEPNPSCPNYFCFVPIHHTSGIISRSLRILSIHSILSAW
jgi:hypothetical protein